MRQETDPHPESEAGAGPTTQAGAPGGELAEGATGQLTGDPAGASGDAVARGAVSEIAGRRLGYARVSTAEQSLDLQLDALRGQGQCEEILHDIASGAKTERPGLTAALEELEEGDTLVVWRLDRLGRSMPHLVKTVADLKERGVHFQSLTEAIDTRSAAGELVFNIFGALAQFERSLIQERTRAGLSAARARGRLGGRPKVTADSNPKVNAAKAMHAQGNMSIDDICSSLGVSRATLYRWLKL